MGAVATLTATDSPRPTAEATPEPSAHPDDRRRFTTAVVIGLAVVLLPYLWVLWDLWSPTPNGLRPVPPGFFYDLQARAMFHGHLYVPNGSLGIEGFLHGGHEFTYFGIFPSILRMPVLLVTSRLDGRLTAPSMLLSWLVTGAFTSLLLWRVRLMVRGQAVLGRAEAASYGLFVAAVGGGSVLIYLAASPFVYNEDFAWSVALTVASLFALLGVLERPSWRRVLASGALILLVNLDRTPTGYACVIGAGLCALWFWSGRGGAEQRRWVLPMLGVAAVPFAVSCAVTYGKFGIPVGLPMADQVWAHVNAHRRQFLAANGGKAFSFGFLPSTLVAYLQPFGIRFTDVFPFITTPSAPAASYAGAVLDQTYPTASIPPTMPLLVLLSGWGVVSTFRPRPPGRLAAARILLVAAALGAAGVLLWGYIANRYMADFMPFLIVAGGIGLIDVWRRLADRGLRPRRWALGLLVAVSAYGLFANVAIAAEPSPQMTQVQLNQFLRVQHSLTGSALESTVVHGPTLPYWAPKGELFIAGDCSGLYYSTGQSYKDVPGQQLMHWTWVPVQQGPGIIHTIDVTFNAPQRALTLPVPILTYGRASLYLRQAPEGNMEVQVQGEGADSLSFPLPTGGALPVFVHHGYQLQVLTDPNMKAIEVWQDGSKILGHYLAGQGPARVLATPPSATSALVTVRDVTPPNPHPVNLCRSLLRGAR